AAAARAERRLPDRPGPERPGRARVRGRARPRRDRPGPDAAGPGRLGDLPADQAAAAHPPDPDHRLLGPAGARPRALARRRRLLAEAAHPALRPVSTGAVPSRVELSASRL